MTLPFTLPEDRLPIPALEYPFHPPLGDDARRALGWLAAQVTADETWRDQSFASAKRNDAASWEQRRAQHQIEHDAAVVAARAALYHRTGSEALDRARAAEAMRYAQRTRHRLLQWVRLPARSWDLMVEVYAAEVERRTATVGRVCAAMGRNETGLRYLKRIVRARWLSVDDDIDDPTCPVRLTAGGRQAMTTFYLSEPGR